MPRSIRLSPGSIPRTARWLAVAALPLACGRADGAGLPSIPDEESPATMDGARADAGAPIGALDDAGAVPPETSSSMGCAGGACDAECPPPRTASCRGPEAWTRIPDTGACCRYENDCQAPGDMPRFPTLEECQTDCRCERVTPSDFSQVETANTVFLSTEYVGLDCYCADALGACPATITDLDPDVCSDAFADSMSQAVGCGMVSIQSNGGFTGGAWVFDAASGALVGATDWSDTTRAPCRTYDTIAGREFACAEALVCPLCSEGAPVLGCD